MHVECSVYVKKEGHAGRAGRRRSGHGGEDHWKSGWQNRLCRKRYKTEERPKEGHKTREEAENGITKEGQERGEESRAAQDAARESLIQNRNTISTSSWNVIQYGLR